MGISKLSIGVLTVVSAVSFGSRANACVDSGESQCTSSSASCSESFRLFQDTVQVWRNQSLDKDHCKIDHAIIVLHGRDRDPHNYFSYAVSATQSAGRLDRTLVLAPAFREQTDSKSSTDLYWDRSSGSAALVDWAMGGQSKGPSSVSSYKVIDELIKSIASSGRFPNLKSIVVVGHSAGGQLAHRYALVGNPSNQGLNSIGFGYVAANPSSYAYLDDKRPVSGSVTSFARPNVSGCSGWNEWGYGLEDPNPYIKSTGLTNSQLIQQYRDRRVTYLLGDADISKSGMDTTCYANLEGADSRFQRGTAYFNYIQALYPTVHHTKSVVPRVDHSGGEMIKSAEGRASLFVVRAPASAPSPTPAPTASPTPASTPRPTATPSPTPSPTPSGDATKPTVKLTEPDSGDRVYAGRTKSMSATAKDNVKIAKVEFFVNGVLVCTDTTSSYTCSWSVPSGKNLTYRVSAKATDTSGNTAVNEVTVTSR